MSPRKTRAVKQADDHQDAPDELKIAESSSTAPLATTDEQQQESTSSAASTMATTKAKGKSRAARHQPLLSGTAGVPEAAEHSTKPTVTMEDRQARLSALRAKMASSTKANRKAILSEQSRSRTIASELKPSSASRKLQKAEQLLLERDLRESGQDVERHRNMHYSLEDSEAWDAKLEEKERRKDRGPGDFGDAAERAYQRQVSMLKPDQRKGEIEAASSPSIQAKTELDPDELHYGTHRPSQDAIDRVVNHLNHERKVIQNRSRRRHEETDAEVNYINDSNRHFNKKLKRYYDKQTKEIRENLERGTAL